MVFEEVILSRGNELLLIDCEEDRTLGAVLVGMLREMERSCYMRGGGGGGVGVRRAVGTSLVRPTASP
jgi:hypothetical protein